MNMVMMIVPFMLMFEISFGDKLIKLLEAIQRSRNGGE